MDDRTTGSRCPLRSFDTGACTLGPCLEIIPVRVGGVLAGGARYSRGSAPAGGSRWSEWMANVRTSDLAGAPSRLLIAVVIVMGLALGELAVSKIVQVPNRPTFVQELF